LRSGQDRQISISASERDIVIKVFDQGEGFDFKNMVRHKAHSGDECGRGVQLIFQLMDRVDYAQEGTSNVLIMKKSL